MSMIKMNKLLPGAKTKGKIEVADKKVLTGTFRLSYPHLFEPKEYKGKKSWSISMLFNKSDDISDITVAIQNACIERWGADPANWPHKKIRSKKDPKKLIPVSTIKWCFKDGDIEKPDKPEYEGMIFASATRKKDAPVVCNQKTKTIEDSSGIKAGDYVRAVLIANAYEEEGSAGVSLSLQMVQLVRRGDALGGGRSAADEFDELPEDEEEVLDPEGEEESEEEEETPDY